MASTATESLSKLDLNADFASSAPNLQHNLHLLSPQQIELAKMLLETRQTHMFEHWAEPGVEDDEKKPSLISRAFGFVATEFLGFLENPKIALSMEAVESIRVVSRFGWRVVRVHQDDRIFSLGFLWI
ncbi:hypothetical protein CMV_020034 [Castanea mollissima]|uniref:Uncharacterized protein n=1 Tax=Castanea mollissima TaxID=60419 RepID=A0A8J4VM65_9ROSI|nr:hypothetical protein CMV_020034 [Castanea mollissima]